MKTYEEKNKTLFNYYRKTERAKLELDTYRQRYRKDLYSDIYDLISQNTFEHLHNVRIQKLIWTPQNNWSVFEVKNANSIVRSSLVEFILSKTFPRITDIYWSVMYRDILIIEMGNRRMFKVHFGVYNES